jgi:glycosyltransferase involved in cell wall biosynthesis
MLTVVIATQDCEEPLARTLAALVPGAADGVIGDVVVVDAGSADGTTVVADAAGCTLVASSGPLGARLRRGAEAGRGHRFLMFLRPGAVLEPGWHREVGAYLERPGAPERGAVFRFALDEPGLGARLSEWRVGLGGSLLGLAAPQQGLIVSRRLYAALGGHRDDAGYAEQDLLLRLGARRLSVLRTRALLDRQTAEDQRLGLAGLAMRLPAAVVARRAA